MSSARRQLVIGGHPADEPEIGRWLWCLEEARRRTWQRIKGLDVALEEARRRTWQRIEDLDVALLDWTAREGGNSIGSSLYHIAAIEADYLYADVLEQPFPQAIVELFPYDVREAHGRLTPVRGFDLAWYRQRLDETRQRLLAAFGAMDLADFRRVRGQEAADITPEWTLHHLMQHEAEHRGEIAMVRARAESTSHPRE
jgi:uncharacterized damage-inducible protein DinB